MEQETPFYESEEWEKLEFLSKLGDLGLCYDALTRLCHKYPSLTMDKIESHQRLDPRNRFHLFAEEPSVARFSRGSHAFLFNKAKCDYLLAGSTIVPRQLASQDFEPGCRDEQVNLVRLRTTGFPMLPKPESFTPEGEAKSMFYHARNQTGVCEIKEFVNFKALKKLIKKDPECAAIWKDTKIVFVCRGQKLVPPSLVKK